MEALIRSAEAKDAENKKNVVFRIEIQMEEVGGRIDAQKGGSFR